ncbi:MAG TPA: protoporphyrinogen oxidase [Pyrinomonadaceae bacterium]|nr:protoporphyrinogen oxidase [Pyrinomonadaceae bacterium]
MIGTLNSSKKEATVVGAGISGMLAAYALDRNGYRVTLLEEKERAGGLIQTRNTGHGIAESAAHSLIATRPVRDLCRELGVELVAPRKEAKAKYIVRDGKLCRFPLTFGECVGTLTHAALGRSTSNDSQNLEFWARRHLGNVALDYLLTPFVRGLYGVQPAELGVATAFPSLDLPEGKTLLGAMLTKRRNGASTKEKKSRAAPRFGMGDLVQRLEQRLEKRLGSRFHKGEKVDQLPEAANVIVATPAYAAARLIRPASDTLADKLAEVRYTPIVSVTVFVDRRSFTRPLHGVGVLMPAREETKSLGILFNSSSFAHRVADESRFASFTVMMGGTAQPHWLTASDDEISQAIKLELSAVLGIREPLETAIHRWPAALPQYSVNLRDVWACARESWCAIPGRILFGNYTGQISLRGMIETSATLGCG